MKRLGISSCLALLMVVLSVQAVFAQSDELGIAYGETVQGEISNRNFEVVYTFTGKSGDLVIINLNRDDSADFDPYLYLTTLDNDVIAQNDDFFNLNSRVLAQLPDDGEYLIIATRRGERTGEGQGGFQLSLEAGGIAKLNTTIEGQVDMGATPPTHVYVPETTGVYNIKYSHIQGDYFPNVTVSMINTDSYSYEEDIAQISGRGLQGGALQLTLESGVIYVITLEQNSYDYSANEGDSALYTLVIQEAK